MPENQLANDALISGALRRAADELRPVPDANVQAWVALVDRELGPPGPTMPAMAGAAPLVVPLLPWLAPAAKAVAAGTLKTLTWTGLITLSGLLASGEKRKLRVDTTTAGLAALAATSRAMLDGKGKGKAGDRRNYKTRWLTATGLLAGAWFLLGDTIEECGKPLVAVAAVAGALGYFAGRR